MRTVSHVIDAARRPDAHADVVSPETEVERQRRFAWEAEMIAEADAEIEAGLCVDSEEVDAWIDSIGTEHELPPPAPAAADPAAACRTG
jgi:predicted transcriptional regulator